MSLIKPDNKKAYTFFHDGTLALSRIESTGIRVDVPLLDRMIAKQEVRIKATEEALKAGKTWAAWTRRFGKDANINSETQLGEVLFDVLKLPGGRRTGKSGKWVTDVEVLEKVPSKWVGIGYLGMKKMNKVLGTYLRGIKRETDEHGFLHPSYNLASGDNDAGGAVSFRGSCSMPNFQNIPIRNPEMSKLIRPLFIARPGRVLIEVDFSGIEVRIACCYTKDPQLVKEFTGPTGDPHGDTAQELFLLRKDQVDKKTTRDSAKNQFVFPQFYGSVYFQCASAIWDAMLRRQFRIKDSTRLVIDHLAAKGITELGDCSPEAAKNPKKGTFVHHLKQVEEGFWNKRFKVYTAWKKRWYNDYLRTGQFSMFTGFTCRGVLRRNAVLNYAIQGTAFHCLLKTVMLAQQECDRRGLEAEFVGQIHDSMLADVPLDEVQEFLNVVHHAATVRLAKEWDWITVPMKVEVDVAPEGKSWHAKEAWVKHEGLWRPEAEANEMQAGGPF